MKTTLTVIMLLLASTAVFANSSCPTAPNQHDSYVLAITWQPGFCEYTPKTSSKPECQAMKTGKLVVANLSLHGLWPNNKACGKSYGNCGNSSIDLSEETLKFIQPWMPNFYFGKDFGDYEWKKHGTCQSLDDDSYFRKAVTAVQTVNNSDVGALIIKNIGKTISRKTLIDTINKIHPDAANKFTLLCSGKNLQEIRIKLPIDFKASPTLVGLIGTKPVSKDSDSKECKGDAIYIERSGIN